MKTSGKEMGELGEGREGGWWELGGNRWERKEGKDLCWIRNGIKWFDEGGGEETGGKKKQKKKREEEHGRSERSLTSS